MNPNPAAHTHVIKAAVLLYVKFYKQTKGFNSHIMQEILLNCIVTKVTFTLNWNLVKVSLIGEPADG